MCAKMRMRRKEDDMKIFRKKKLKRMRKRHTHNGQRSWLAFRFIKRRDLKLKISRFSH